MKLHFVAPEDGKTLSHGKLITEDGEEIQGVMGVEVMWQRLSSGDAVPTGKHIQTPTQVRVTMLVETLDDLQPDRVDRAIRGLVQISDLNSEDG